jgi:hypothetical protein
MMPRMIQVMSLEPVQLSFSPIHREKHHCPKHPSYQVYAQLILWFELVGSAVAVLIRLAVSQESVRPISEAAMSDPVPSRHLPL